jgi:hypothetical protein
MTETDLKPWMHGPFELIRHADGHLREGDDTDRRIALIGFDNAIEVSIDVYVRYIRSYGAVLRYLGRNPTRPCATITRRSSS